MSQHHEKEYSILEIALNLFGACVISGIIIGAVYFLTADIAIAKSEMLKNQAMQSLVADADAFTAISGKEGWFEAKSGSDVIAYVVPGESKGFGGEIKMLVAISKEGAVMDYVVLKHNETPGLGDLAGKEPFKGQFKGKTSEQLEVTKDPSKTENIQALTGATITTRAVTKGVKEALEEVKQYMEGL